MSKVHISLVGGQPMPVYLGIMNETPERIILIYSEETKKQAKAITDITKKKLGINCCGFLLSPVDFSEIKSKLPSITNSFSDTDDISVNVTGGSKPWSLLFYSYFSTFKNSCCFFIDQNNFIWNLNSNEKTKIGYKPNMDEIFSLNGTKVRSHEKLSDYDNKDFTIINKIRKIREYWPTAFQIITNDLDEKSSSSYRNWSIEWDSSSKEFICEYSKCKNGQLLTDRLYSPKIKKILPKTKWFELEVATYLSNWELAKEIWLSCTFTNIDAKSNQDLNEVDIIINTGDKMLFVECKTQINAITDVDKFNQVIRNYGGLATKGIFITDKPLRPEHGDNDKFKTNDGIKHFVFQDIKDDKNYFSILTKLMYETNKK